jgi:uncharacterized protein (TIGR03000 family)
MRKLLVIGLLAFATMTAFSSDAFAQRRGGGGGRGGWGGGGWGGGRGTGIYIGGGGIGVYGGGYGGGYGGYGYGRPYYGSSYYSTPYYYSSPSYYEPSYTYESTPIVQAPATDVRQSYYSEPAYSQQNTATMMVLVPRPDATVWFDNAQTSQQGMERTFVSPPLASGGTYTYTIRARWMENGQPVERERRINVQPGQTVNVDFRGPAGETLQAPPRTK